MTFFIIKQQFIIPSVGNDELFQNFYKLCDCMYKSVKNISTNLLNVTQFLNKQQKLAIKQSNDRSS